eukprot:scaffold51604_cov18-Tisochrysis_lutea.AAC.1
MGDVQLSLPCASTDAISGQCVSFLPPWVLDSSKLQEEWLPPSSVGVPPPRGKGAGSKLIRERRGRGSSAPASAPAPPSPPAGGWGSSTS